MKYFGDPDAPVHESVERVPAPVGRACIDCGVHIFPSDSGFILPFAGDPESVGDAVYHRLCLARCLGVEPKKVSPEGVRG
jgi:hypothetical protein